MATMQVIRFHEYGEPSVLQSEEMERPEPGKGEVLIKIEAVGLNYADTRRRRNSYLVKTPVPYILGGEIAGTIEALGPETPAGLAVGGRVLALVETGGYAQYAVVNARQLFPLPDALSYTDAVTIAVQGMTSYEIIKMSGQLQEGESVLVHAAAGGVGIYSVQLAKLLGAGQVIATASTEAKLELARSLGADTLVNYTEPDWAKKVKGATGGRGADIILEMVGGEVFNQSLTCLAPYGRMVVFGAASDVLPTLNPIQLMYRNQSVIGYWLTYSLTRRPQQFAAGLQTLMGWVAEGKLKTVVEQTFPLAEAAAAHTALEGRGTVGKLVLLPQS